MAALAGNISEMLSNFDGVITARVILVLPSNDPYSNAKNPASASVFLKIRPGFDTTTQIPQIKQLVMNSVEGLNYERVAVTLVRSDEVDFFNPLKLPGATSSFLGINVPAESLWIFYTLAGLVGVLVLAVAGGGTWLYIRHRREVKPAEPAVEPPPAS
jgi:type III secretion protein J